MKKWTSSNEVSYGKLHLSNPSLQQRSESLTAKAQQKVMMAQGMFGAYKNISTESTGKSSKAQSEHGQWPEKRYLEELEDLTPQEEK